jgi:PAS domain S-box-containing protein
LSRFKEKQEEMQLGKQTDPSLKIIMDVSPVGIVAIGDDARIIYANPLASKLFSKPATEVFGLKCGDLIDCLNCHDKMQVCGQTASCPRCSLFNAISTVFSDGANEAVQEGEAFLERDPGLPAIWVKYKVRSILMKGEKVAIMTIDDITDRKQAEKELIKSEKRFRSFFENSAVAVAIIDQDGHVVEANEIACRILGYPRSEFIGMHFAQITHPDDLFLDADLYKSLYKGERQSYKIEKRYVRKDGKVVWGNLWVSVISENQDSSKYMMVVCEDITERKRMEADLEDSHQRMLTVFHSMDAIVYVADMETYELLFLNRYAQSINGNIVGEKCWETLQKGKTGPCEFCSNDKLLDAAGQPTGIYHWENYDKKTGRWYECHVNAMPWIDRRMVRLEIALDITERKRAEEAIKESEERFRTLFEESLNPILVADENEKYIDANKAALEFLECDRNELVKRNVWDFAPPGKLDVMKKNHTPFMSRRTIETEHFVNGTIKTLMLNVVPVKIKGTTSLYGIGQDITERKQNEKVIKDSLREKETLLKEVHHRVKNNMQVISSLLNLQIMRSKDGQIKKALMDCQGRVGSMASAHEMLYMSDSLSFIDCEKYISKLSGNILQSYQTDLRRVKLKVAAKGAKLGIQQASSLGLIIYELLSNALKYGFPENMRGQVMIRLKMTGQDIMEFVFQDNGVGIPEKIDWRNTSSLGLSLIVHLAEKQLRGTVNMNSGEGTSFTIKFNRENNQNKYDQMSRQNF